MYIQSKLSKCIYVYMLSGMKFQTAVYVRCGSVVPTEFFLVMRANVIGFKHLGYCEHSCMSIF